ncbi:poly-beta-1,6-N-acetyl-D-glucosamine N-deacetylase PgaB [Crenobacter sp. SG2305]|uniref:poly-beta-1,6-N-acetyl-D-glucosamine N-deacetylase PgaB n=1 Tax=Crenobacter oryzisoli TaxID=3056844 RepID=UPI0025AB4A7B|nr:poly-beta-1,6-N-acetyl-D-glucosamine N-deacetylase PgaB [Crenobacter sp. SG2305]MDN0084716.1 poly-beta-1,6-N-acetyl-D-glucosamine N-deacetylase PgaB [Crenobacter sp. SG2305]
MTNRYLFNALIGLLFMVMASLVGAAPAASGSRLIVLCYHEVVQNVQPDDPYSVDAVGLVKQLEWMRGRGYQFVSVDDVLADRAGTRPLPEKAVLLSFDDGYESVYSYVFPILKLFKAPAVIGLVGSWLDAPQGGQVNYSGKTVPRANFLTWSQIREMQASGLVEVASHTYDLHYGQIANPQGNEEPAASTQHYDVKTERYESRDQMLARVRADFIRNSALIKRETGKAPRVMVWPYGSYTKELTDITTSLGMPITLTLDDGVNLSTTPLSRLRRVLIDASMTLRDLAYIFKSQETAPNGLPRQPTRAMRVSIDSIYDADPVVFNNNLGKLLDRVKEMGPSLVYLQAYSDPGNTGVAQSLYFPNRHMPVRADLFNRVAWQLHTRAGVEVYAWLPLLAYHLPDGAHLSPYSAASRTLIRDIYEDLGQSGRFAGLLMQDDGQQNEQDDASADALRTYQQWGLPASLEQIRQDPKLAARWSEGKTEQVNDFSLELAKLVQRYQPDLRVARTLNPNVVLHPESRAWISQSFDKSLSNYNYIVISALSRSTGGEDGLRTLFQKVASYPGGLDKTVFELPSQDGRNGEAPVPVDTLEQRVVDLHTWGARNIGYAPDEPFQNNPDVASFKRVFSMTSEPER